MPAEKDFIFLPDYHSDDWNSETAPENTIKGSVLASELKNVCVGRFAGGPLHSGCAM